MRIERIFFKQRKTVLIINVPPPLTMTTNLVNFREILLERLPSLRSHTCHNDNGLSFLDELPNTELAHVLEHILIELITEKDSQVGVIAGWTNWNWHEYPRWSYKVDLNYSNPAVLLDALHESLRILGEVIEVTSKRSEIVPVVALPDVQEFSIA